MTKKSNSTVQKSLAWLVHVFTASGLVAGFLSILAINESNFRLAMFWLICAGIIDGVDGTFARILKVKEILPNVNGTMIDTTVDFVNYALVPAYMLYSAGVFPEMLNIPLVAIILVTSAVYYGKEGMVSEDMYFVGFPVLWNVLAFYILFVFSASASIYAIIIVIFAVLHFVPLKFAYPSRKSRFQKLDLTFSFILLITMMIVVYLNPSRNLILSLIAFACGIYFLVMAVYNTYRK
jgi:phosphatidylcholine synthase